MTDDRHLLCLGFGFSARTLAAELLPRGWRVTGTTRSEEGLAAIEAAGVTARRWSGAEGDDDLAADLASATHIVSSVPPRADGDPALDLLVAHLGKMPRLEWLALLSTTGVYGDHGGDWVDEDTPLVASTHRSGRRVDQNAAWMTLYQDHGLPVHIFRLAGIYGPGRSALDKLRAGTARRIIKPGQVFSRIHVEDISLVLQASIARPDPGAAYNLADDLPGPPQDVIAFAAGLLGLPVPPDIPFETAEMTPMARSFYADSKKVRNTRIKQDLGVTLRWPTYMAGLTDLRDRDRG